MKTVLRKCDEEVNMARFYSVAVAQTLFGDWAVIREWGRIGSEGQRKEVGFATECEAQAAFERLVREKLRRGYSPSPGIWHAG